LLGLLRDGAEELAGFGSRKAGRFWCSVALENGASGEPGGHVVGGFDAVARAGLGGHGDEDALGDGGLGGDGEPGEVALGPLGDGVGLAADADGRFTGAPGEVGGVGESEAGVPAPGGAGGRDPRREILDGPTGSGGNLEAAGAG